MNLGVWVLVLVLLATTSCKESKEEPTSVSKAMGEKFDETKEFTGKLIRVKNGDTFTMLVDGFDQEVTIQLAEIDAPEGGQPYGKESKQLLTSLLEGNELLIKPQGRDKFDRLLGVVFIPQHININIQMVGQGAAWHYKEYSTDSTLSKLEADIRSQGLGLWTDPNPIPPWEYRLLQRQ